MTILPALGAALKALLEVPAHRSPFELGNGSISRVEWEKEFKLLTLNESAHLHVTGEAIYTDDIAAPRE
mgnify:CR=1 FL=1